MGTQWIPLTERIGRTKGRSGVVAFSILQVAGNTVSMPDVRLIVEGGAQWTALTSHKQNKVFRLGLVDSDPFDLFLLKGGMLRFSEEQDTLIVEVQDKLGREDEIGFRVWRHRASLKEIADTSQNDVSITFDLKKEFTKKPTILNKTIDWKFKNLEKLKRLMLGGETIRSSENETMRIELQFGFYYE